MKKEIELKPKKPKLAYVGMDKKTLAEAVPTQVVEVIYPHKAAGGDNDTPAKLFEEGQLGTGKVKKLGDLPKNRLIWTNDNLVALKTLLDEKDSVSGEYKYRNKIDLIYIDPPFMVQNDFVAENSIDIEVDEEEGVISVKEPTIIETIAYKDTWKNGLDSFLQMMRERLVLMKELLSPTGSIYVHLDWHTSHYVKVLMDEIFDYGLFRNEIIWFYPRGGDADKQFNRKHDTIFWYSKSSEKWTFNWEDTLIPYSEEQLARFKEKDEKGKFYWNKNPRGETVKTYLRKDGIGEYDVWNIGINATEIKEINYPTTKPPRLLERIIKASSNTGDIIADFFCGSGTTLAVAEKLGRRWIGVDNSKFAIHTARKRLIELSGKPKEKKGEGIYKVRPFTVENMGYYQRGAKWDPIQVGNQADAYRQAIIELFGGEYTPYSKLLHGKKRGAWIHVGPLSQPIVSEQIQAIAKEVKDTEFKKCYVLSADFTAHLNQSVDEAKKELGVQVLVRMIPASAIEEVKKRLELMRQGVDPEKVSEMPNIAFFAPLAVKIHKVADGKEASIELSGLEVDAESFLESQKPERKDELKKWLEKEKSWQSFVDFWAVDWDYENLKNKEDGHGPIFENEWQSFRKRKGKKVVEDLVFKAFHTYEKAGEYTIAVKVTDVFGNDGIVTAKVVIK